MSLTESLDSEDAETTAAISSIVRSTEGAVDATSLHQQHCCPSDLVACGSNPAKLYRDRPTTSVFCRILILFSYK